MIAELVTPGTLAAALRIGTPLLLAAIGAAICLKAGIFNIALEGLMLIGAFAAVVLTAMLGSPLLGTGLALILTTATALLYGVVTITWKADQIIAGLGFNMAALGLTSWILQSVLHSPGGFVDPRVRGLPVVEVALFHQIPLLGAVFNGHDISMYGSWLLAGLAYLFVHQTKYGLRLRATGEHPVAATTMGIRTVYWQYLAVALSGLLAGLAGASITLAHLNLFSHGLTAGRGFIALAAATFANGGIPGTTFISFLFAFFGSVAIRLEGFGLPTQFVQMIPYLITLVALVVAKQRAR